MDFTTKFNLKEMVWYMKDNKPTEVIISAIEIFYVDTSQDYIMYKATDAMNPVTWIDHQFLREAVLFRSKEELLKSL